MFFAEIYKAESNSCLIPIEIKTLVLDNCLFNSILYAAEVFGNIDCIEKKLRLAEQKHWEFGRVQHFRHKPTKTKGVVLKTLLW